MKRLLEAGESPGALWTANKVSRIFLDAQSLKSLNFSNAAGFVSARSRGPSGTSRAVKIALVKDINLASNGHLTEEELAELAGLDTGAHFPFLLSANLSNTVAGDVFLDRLTSISPSIEALKLNFCANITDSSVILIAARLKYLNSLELSGNTAISSFGVAFLIENLGHSLVELDLSATGVEINEKMMESIHLKCPKLKILRLGGLNLTNSAIARLTSSDLRLEELDLAHSQVNSDNLASLLAKFACLKKVNVSFCYNLAESVILAAMAVHTAAQVTAFGFDFVEDEISSPILARLRY